MQNIKIEERNRLEEYLESKGYVVNLKKWRESNCLTTQDWEIYARSVMLAMNLNRIVFLIFGLLTGYMLWG